MDNCPTISNDDQADADGDGVGDACDRGAEPSACSGKGGDADVDDVCQSADNCPDVVNPAQRDSDGDGFGDDCDETPAVCDDLGGDADADTICNALDNCPETSNVNQLDRDSDNVGDVCDPTPPVDPSGPRAGLGGDEDGDDYCGFNDNCPTDANVDQSDTDGDDLGDACDKETCDGDDNDGDTVIDEGFADSDAEGPRTASTNARRLRSSTRTRTGSWTAETSVPSTLSTTPTWIWVYNAVDNCPNKANDGQGDSDKDGWRGPSRRSGSRCAAAPPATRRRGSVEGPK